MARPNSWYETAEYNEANRASKDRGHGLWKYTRKDREGQKVQGYFVGPKLPARLRTAETKKVR